MIEAYPLQWPAGYPRTKNPARSKFDTTFAVARNSIMREVKLLGGKAPIISTNIPLRNDGLPYASFKTVSDKGVAVYFTYNNNSVVLACDKWDKIEDNMQAIRKAIDALRSLDRWGVSDILNRAFTGFVALPDSTKKHWSEVLCLPRNANESQIKEAYRRLAIETYPDRGGSALRFIEVKEAYEDAIKSKI